VVNLSFSDPSRQVAGPVDAPASLADSLYTKLDNVVPQSGAVGMMNVIPHDVCG